MKQRLKYLDIVDWIKSELAEGKLKAGDRLPSENELAEKFRVSRQTARHAIDVLAADRLVSRVRGSGTYIGPVGGRTAGTGLHPGRNRHHGTIAVMSTYVDGYIFPNTVRGIEQVLVRSGYVMQLCFTGNKIHRERELLEKMVSTDRIDGLIVEAVKSALPNPNFKYFSRLSGLGVPILFINAAYPGLPYPLVALNDSRMAFRATQYLVDRGHRKIGGIFKADDGQGRLRYQGYAECMRTIGRGVDERSVFWIDTVAMQEMEKFAPYLLERIHGCTAVVCYNDQVAYALATILKKYGIRVPEDVSLIGMDDADIAAMAEVPITTFPHPKFDLGKKAAENLLKMIDDPTADGNYLFETEVCERDSVKTLVLPKIDTVC